MKNSFFTKKVFIFVALIMGFFAPNLLFENTFAQTNGASYQVSDHDIVVYEIDIPGLNDQNLTDSSFLKENDKNEAIAEKVANNEAISKKVNNNEIINKKADNNRATDAPSAGAQDNHPLIGKAPPGKKVDDSYIPFFNNSKSDDETSSNTEILDFSITPDSQDTLNSLDALAPISSSKDLYKRNFNDSNEIASETKEFTNALIFPYESYKILEFTEKKEVKGTIGTKDALVTDFINEAKDENSTLLINAEYSENNTPNALNKDSSNKGASNNIREALAKEVLNPIPAAGRRVDEEKEPSKNLVRAIFLGDIMVHGQQLKVALGKDGEYDFRSQVSALKPLMKNAMVIGNLETTLSGKEVGYSGYPQFNSPDVLIDAIKELGISVVTLANNHIMDRGNKGARRTMEVLDEKGIFWTGLSTKDIIPNQPLLLEYEGLKWALLSFTYGSNAPAQKNPEDPVDFNLYKEESILEGINIAKEHGVDIIVCLIHWGNEYHVTPTKHQVDLAKFAVDNGADLVIGTHPHVLQPMSVLPTSKGHAFVAYSLGNFISNQRTAPRERGAVVAVDFEKLPEGGVKLSRVSVAPIYVWSDCGKGKASCHIQLVYGGGDIPDEIEKNQKSEETIEATTVERSLFFYEDANPYLTKNQDIIDASYTLTEVESITDSDKVLLAEENPKLKADKGKNTKNNDKNSNNDDNAKKEQDIEVFTLSAKELKRIADISKNILEFLGASLEQDNGGFYTLWYSKEPDKLPVGTRKAPN